ncbi:MAG: hypothetical protein ACYDG2_04075, partial [Ruminiclostridium sp.]
MLSACGSAAKDENVLKVGIDDT